MRHSALAACVAAVSTLELQCPSLVLDRPKSWLHHCCSSKHLSALRARIER